MEKSCRKSAPKASSRFLFNFWQILEDYQKAFKKLSSFFLLNPVPVNEQDYEKQKRSGTSDQSLFRLQSKFKKIPLLMMCYLTKFGGVI